jgi:hypothetical protein
MASCQHSLTLPLQVVPLTFSQELTSLLTGLFVIPGPSLIRSGYSSHLPHLPHLPRSPYITTFRYAQVQKTMNEQTSLKVALSKTAGDRGTFIAVPGAPAASLAIVSSQDGPSRYAHPYYLPQAVLLVRDPTIEKLHKPHDPQTRGHCRRQMSPVLPSL